MEIDRYDPFRQERPMSSDRPTHMLVSTGVRLLLASALGFAALSAAAGTRVVIPDDDGHTQICRFAAGTGDDPFQRWLSSQEVACVASDSVMDFPTGHWNVFAQRQGAMSAGPILVNGASPPRTLPTT